MASTAAVSDAIAGWLEQYTADNADLVQANPEFAAWLATDYVPIAGGWQY